jgi:uncharacterized membrane protein HdeD (DUF308 family)
VPSNPLFARALYVWFALSTAAFAVIETFNRVETIEMARWTWGGFLVVLGIGHGLIFFQHKRPAGWGIWSSGHSLTAIAIGLLTVVVASTPTVLVWSMAVWSLLAGASTLWIATRLEKGTERSDWFVVGAGTLIFSVVTIVVPGDLVWTMGIAGVWASIVTVFLGIGAVNLRLARKEAKD